MNARNWGVLLAWLSGMMLFYFWLIFDDSVASGTVRVVNLEKMQDRNIGVAVSVALGALAVVLIVRNPKIARVSYPPPVAPSSFKLPIQSAVHYTVPRPSSASMSRPNWQLALGQRVNLGLYNQRQFDWAYASGVTPDQFAEFVGFVEAYRNWMGIKRYPIRKPTALELTCGLSAFGLFVLWFVISLQKKPEPIPTPRPVYTEDQNWNYGAQPQGRQSLDDAGARNIANINYDIQQANERRNAEASRDAAARRQRDQKAADEKREADLQAMRENFRLQQEKDARDKAQRRQERNQRGYGGGQ